MPEINSKTNREIPVKNKLAPSALSRQWATTYLESAKQDSQALNTALTLCLKAKTPIALFWGQDHILLYNDAFGSLLGNNNLPQPGCPAHEFFKDSWDKVRDKLDQVLSTGKATEIESQLTSMKPGHFGFDFTFNPIPEENGSVNGILCIASEAKQQIQSPPILDDQEQSFREMINALPVAIYTTDTEGHLTHFNPAAVEFSGHQPQLGTDQWCVTWKLYWPDGTYLPHDECPMAIALKEGRSVYGMEAIAERPDGKRIWFQPYPSPLYDEHGNIIGGINMLVDITKRKKAELQTQRSEQELTDFFENATIGLHLVGPDGIILRANQAEMDLLGYSREEYIGQSITKFHADQHVIDDILHRLSSGEELNNYEARLICKDGSIKTVLISSNVLWEDGKFIHTRCFTRDITERKEYEETQALLLGELNHRVNNTLATIQAIANQTLQKSTLPEDFVEDFNGRIKSLSRAHLQLTRSNWSGAFVQNILQEQLQLHTDDHRVVCSGPPVYLSSKSSLHLALVLHELGTNARKYGSLSSATGRVTVKWRIISAKKSQILDITWVEEHGPVVEKPKQAGFGQKLIEQSLRSVGGKTSLHYNPSGVLCKISLPVSYSPRKNGLDNKIKGFHPV